MMMIVVDLIRRRQRQRRTAAIFTRSITVFSFPHRARVAVTVSFHFNTSIKLKLHIYLFLLFVFRSFDRSIEPIQRVGVFTSCSFINKRDNIYMFIICMFCFIYLSSPDYNYATKSHQHRHPTLVVC